MPHDRMLASRNTYTWIQKYIFPGGLLPSVEAIIGITERAHPAAHRRHDVHCGPHYAETLRLWRERFLRAARDGVRVGLRRGLPPHVGAVPGLLGGRIPVGLPRRVPVDLRPDGRNSMNFLRRHRRIRCRAAVHARHHVRRRPPHRPLQRRRRDVGPGVRRRRGRRSGARYRRSVPAAPAARPCLGVGSSTRLAHGRQVRGQGRGSAVRGAAGRRLLRRPRGAQDLPHPGARRRGSSRCRFRSRPSSARHRPRCSRF